MNMLRPPFGYRTHAIMLLALFVGTGIALVGLFLDRNLGTLAALVGAVTAPVAGFKAWDNRNGGGPPPVLAAGAP